MQKYKCKAKATSLCASGKQDKSHIGNFIGMEKLAISFKAMSL